MPIYADADDAGLSFIFPAVGDGNHSGGLQREANLGHLSTIVGRGGSGKSILALQLVTQLLDEASAKSPEAAAFYFTLEAGPSELLNQVRQFEWGKRYVGKSATLDGNDLRINGLYLMEVPAPAASVNELCLRIRQAIARALDKIGPLVAIVVDPIGAVASIDNTPTDFSKLRAVSESHRTFLFLLSEKHAFDRHTSLEHYSQSIIHLDHDPKELQHRRLYVQKARGQNFRSGYHQFELLPARQPRSDATSAEAEDFTPLSGGIRVFPSLQAQSADAHELLARRPDVLTPPLAFFPDEDVIPFLSDEEKIERGSAVFLMGPPGTFKEYIASEFASTSADAQEATIYLSFKADYQTVKKYNPRAKSIPLGSRLNPALMVPNTYFMDARSPLLTPDEVLFAIRNVVIPTHRGNEGQPAGAKFGRAVIWGLRRLDDLPHFGHAKAVQFLEALVTLLKSQLITSLLVDWPDRETPNTVPIADLCQYIFLTRVARPEHEPGTDIPAETRREIAELWHPQGLAETAQVAMLRVQRTRRGSVHHDQGAVFRQFKGVPTPKRFSATGPNEVSSFEHQWLHLFRSWEEDLSLLS